MGRGWWRIVVVALLCGVGMLVGAGGGVEAAARPKVTWTFDPPVRPVDAGQKASYQPASDYFRVALCPGQEVRVSGTITVRLTRPRPTVPMRYELDDRLGSFAGCEQPAPGGPRHVCYLTV